MNETRRKFFSMAAGLLPLGLFVKKKNVGEIKDARIYKRSLDQSEIVAESLAKDRDYWRERCMGAEKDLIESRANITEARLLLEDCAHEDYENDVKHILRAASCRYRHPDCMKETA